ncbi:MULTISPECIES: hypothetical protein [unclassified Pseudomonas]|uniref:hypothetical protein n=1 Tax=unclassified Pseudomonas TaxID=196821 RepID=UPI00095D7A98|nr:MULTISPECIES: hypothetical protein [unclassified Pseudomonas]OLU13133.1 hypothetical protein BVH01_22545 [Pseudomonas sp. PA1(2017)]OLU25941.1 hypothetical protein BVH06_19990 [Pseudomonas sp. PA27(2017)]
MSSLVITMAIIGGITLLVLLAYLNQLAENNKRKKARLKADLAERYRRIADLNEQFAGQFMTPELKLLLCSLQLQFAERILEVDKQDSAYATMVEELRKLIAMGPDIPVRNAPYHVTDDAKATQVRAQLEALHGQVGKLAQTGQLPVDEAKKWAKEIRHMLVQLYVDLYGNQAKQALQQQQNGHARLALERGVQFLQKQADAARYQATLAQFQKQLERVNAMLVSSQAPSGDANSELDEGLKSMEDDGDWKKKALYD